MSNSNPLTNPLFLKGTSSFAYSFLIDKFVFKNDSLSQNAIFGAGVTSGLLIGQSLGAYIPEILPDQAGLYSGKLVSQRVVEISVGATTGYIINAYVFKNDYDRSSWMKKIGTILLVDVLSEYTVDYLVGNNLGYFVE